MIRRERPIKFKVNFVRTTVSRSRRIDGYLCPCNLFGHGLSKIPDLIVAIIRSSVDRQISAPVYGRTVDRPVDCARHVGNVDQRAPWRSVGQYTDKSSTERACDKI